MAKKLTQEQRARIEELNPGVKTSEHNDTGFMSTKSETFLYPLFPYYPEDQPELKAPDYEKCAEDHANLCYDSKLIQGWSWRNEGFLKVMYIHMFEGETLRLSDMQAMLYLKGILAGYKELRHQELGLRENMTQFGKNLKKIDRVTSNTGDWQDIDESKQPKKRTTKSKRKKKKKKVDKATQGMIDSILENTNIGKVSDDDSWMDDLF